MFWVKADDWTQGGAVLGWDEEQENRFIAGFDAKGEFRVCLYDENGRVTNYIDLDENGLALTDGEFYHFAVTVDEDKNISLYIDGVQQTMGVSSLSNYAALNSAVIGARSVNNFVDVYHSNPGYPMAGALDDLAIFSGILDETEIGFVMNQGVAAIPEPSTLMLLGALFSMIVIRRARG
jgi:hypothetical protein